MRKEERLYRQRQKEFHEIINAVKFLGYSANDEVEKIELLDFAIWALGQEIAGSENWRLLHGASPLRNEKYLLPRFPDSNSEIVWVDVCQCATYHGIWRCESIANTMRQILRYGYVEESDARGIYYPELRFAVITEGRHRRAVGIYAGECISKLEQVSLKPYFSRMETDGMYFQWRNEYGEPNQQYIPDVRFAAMYRLAQMREERLQRVDPRQVRTPEFLKKYSKEDDFLAAKVDDLHRLADIQSRRLKGQDHEIWKLKDQIKCLEQQLQNQQANG